MYASEEGHKTSSFLVDSLETLLDFIDSIDTNQEYVNTVPICSYNIDIQVIEKMQNDSLLCNTYDCDSSLSNSNPIINSSACKLNPMTPNESISLTNYEYSQSSDENDPMKSFDFSSFQIKNPSTSRSRTPKLYEFLQMVLNNPCFASYASWIEKDEGLFKIHQPQKVTNLWRKVKTRRRKRLMNYETLSRGIRYYYKSGRMLKTHTKHTYRFATQQNF